MAKKNKPAEQKRIDDHYNGKENWLKWGPYLSERQWGTVREDYSASGEAWEYFPHDHARSRVYRWGEDGLAGISDEFQSLCFSLALWNGNDPILKERLFGLTGPEGNHGEDVKELYYYLDNTPTHSYMKYLYKYPQAAFPYEDLLHTNASRSKNEREYELIDTGIFDDDQYFDVYIEYAKEGPDDILIKISAFNRGKKKAGLSILPTLWFRNLWSFNKIDFKPGIQKIENLNGFGGVHASHKTFGDNYLYFDLPDRYLFTENETNTERLYGHPNRQPFVKDSINNAVVKNNFQFFGNYNSGTKFSPYYKFIVNGGKSCEVNLRLSGKPFQENPLNRAFAKSFGERIKEADSFYSQFIPENGCKDTANVQRQAFAGMLWTKQLYHIDIPEWLNGDAGQPEPDGNRKKYGRNHEWQTLNNNDIISMPDKWEYPWYAAWDLAFHCVPLAMIDPEFAKNQLILIMREWYMAPNGQIPAYEWAFSDVNPPVQAWAALKVYEIEKNKTGTGDIKFLKRVFSKLMINFTWWVNRKDKDGKNVFEGGFLGLDNIGVFDRSNQLPEGGVLEQADGTSWMAMYSLNMMHMALEISTEDDAFEDVATKFFEHFIYIAEAINRMSHDWASAWDVEDGFFYDLLALPGDRYIPLKVRSLVGLSTLFAVDIVTSGLMKKVPDFFSRLNWFVKYRNKLGEYCVIRELRKHGSILLSLADEEKLKRLLQAMLDESEFLAPGGIRSVSKIHKDGYQVNINGQQFGMDYQPGESNTHLFGGNSNWRGPIWMPMNYLLIESIRKYYEYYGNEFKVELPTGSGNFANLNEVANELSNRLIKIFLPDKDGHRPVNDRVGLYTKKHFKDLVLFYEYFHGENSRGVGAAHQTGWTGVVAELINRCGW